MHNKVSAFTSYECRRTLSEFEPALVAHAVHVSTGGVHEQFEHMSRGNEARALFWAGEWLAADHIDTSQANAKQLIEQRMKSVRALRNDRIHADRNMIFLLVGGVVLMFLYELVRSLA